jgi:hypothetical protein
MNRSSSRVEFASCAPSDAAAFEVGVVPGVEAGEQLRNTVSFPPGAAVIFRRGGAFFQLSADERRDAKKVTKNDNGVNRAPQNLRQSHSS